MMAPGSSSAHPWGGIYASLICPMAADGEIDFDALRQHARTVFGGTGLAGFLINGHAGENAVLTAHESRRVIEVVRAACPTARLVAGINREGSAAAAGLARDAAEAGAHAVMLFAPYSWALGADPRAIVAHHRAVHDATECPLFLFQGTIRSGLAYESAVMAALLALPRVVGIKEGSWDVAGYERVLRQTRLARPDVGVMASGDEHLLPCFRLGSDGSLVSLAAIVPAEIVALDAAVQGGDEGEAERLNARLEPLATAIYGTPPGSLATARIKWCLHRLGRIPSPACRAPTPPLSAAEGDRLAAALAAAGLMS